MVNIGRRMLQSNFVCMVVSLFCLYVVVIVVAVSLTESYFNKCAGGAPTISEEDFARILLRHTTWDLDPVFERLKRKAKPETVSLSSCCGEAIIYSFGCVKGQSP